MRCDAIMQGRGKVEDCNDNEEDERRELRKAGGRKDFRTKKRKGIMLDKKRRSTSDGWGIDGIDGDGCEEGMMNA
jgi:hypothetical protein